MFGRSDRETQRPGIRTDCSLEPTGFTAIEGRSGLLCRGRPRGFYRRLSFKPGLLLRQRLSSLPLRTEAGRRDYRASRRGALARPAGMNPPSRASAPNQRHALTPLLGSELDRRASYKGPNKMASDRIAVIPTAIASLAQNFHLRLGARRVFPTPLRLKTLRPAGHGRCDPFVQVRASRATLSIIGGPDASCRQSQMIPAFP